MSSADDDRDGTGGFAPTRMDPSPGAMLKAERERQGLHIAMLAAAIKVSPRKLDALENDRHHELTDATFVRALAQTVCRALKMEPGPVLERLPKVRASALEQVDGGLNAPFRDRPGRRDPSATTPHRPLLWAGAALLVAAGVVAFAPWIGPWSGAGDAVAPLATASAPAASMPAASAASASAAVAAPASSAASAATAASSAVEAPVAAATATPAPPPATPAPASAPLSETIHAAPVAVAAETNAPLVSANEPSWIEATDGAGQVLLSRIVAPGETVRLQGALPIRLKIGNARGTNLVFRGREVDLSPSSRDNVARVELK
jgi:cytoskeleton protein RodZ